MYFSCKSNFSSLTLTSLLLQVNQLYLTHPAFIPERDRLKPLRIKFILSVTYQSRTSTGFNIMFMFSNTPIKIFKSKNITPSKQIKN